MGYPYHREMPRTHIAAHVPGAPKTLSICGRGRRSFISTTDKPKRLEPERCERCWNLYFGTLKALASGMVLWRSKRSRRTTWYLTGAYEATVSDALVSTLQEHGHVRLEDSEQNPFDQYVILAAAPRKD